MRDHMSLRSTPELGGETVFPNASGVPGSGQGWRQHKRGGLAVDARAGSLLLFRNVGEDGLLDRASLHESKAVTLVRGRQSPATPALE